MAEAASLSLERRRDDARAVPGALRSLAPYLLYILVAVPIGVFNLWTINHDAVSYVSLAQHYIDGKWAIALSGTWSPLFIWIVAGALRIAHDPFVALRIAMGISGLAFVIGCCDVLKHLPAVRWMGPVALLCAVCAAIATGGLITPDLLSAGIFLIGFRVLLQALVTGSAVRCGLAGALIGLAFIAKSVFLPIGIAAVGVSAVAVGWVGGRARTLMIGAAAAVLGITIVAAPWVAALSIKYGQLTITRANIPQFASIGPPDEIRDQPTNVLFYVPEAGRQSQFEDESILPVATWSPFASMKYFRHYVRHVTNNVAVIGNVIREFEVTGLGIALLPFAFAFALRRSRLKREVQLDWSWLAIPVVLTIAAYMLNFASQSRYFLIAVPPILLATCLGYEALGRLTLGRRGRAIGGAVAVALILFAFGKQAQTMNVLTNQQSLPQALAPVAAELRDAGYVGPVAALDVTDKMQAIVLSFLLGTTYNGTQNIKSVDEIEQSCAKLLLARRNSVHSLLLQATPQKVRLINGAGPGIGSAAARWGFDAFWVIDPDYANWRCRTSPPSEIPAT